MAQRVTQDANLTLGEGSPNARVTQDAVLVLADVPTSNIHVTQLPRLTILNPTDANLRVTQLLRAALLQPTDANLRLTQLARLVPFSPTSNFRLTQVARLALYLNVRPAPWITPDDELVQYRVDDKSKFLFMPDPSFEAATYFIPPPPPTVSGEEILFWSEARVRHDPNNFAEDAAFSKRKRAIVFVIT